MKTLKGVLAASRPISWVNTAFPFGLAYLLAGGGVNWLLILGFVFFLVPYNIAMYGINDVFDYESDLRNPRKGGVEGAVLPRSMHAPLLWFACLSTLPFLTILFFAGTWVSAGWLMLSMFAVVAYSAPGLRFKERAVIDSLTSSAHFTGPALVGWTITGADVNRWFVLAVTAFFLWGMASHAFGAVQDVKADRKAGLSSVAVVLGARTTTRVSVIAYAVAAAMVMPLPGMTWLVSVFGLGYVAITARYWNITDARCEEANASWRVFLWLNYVTGAVVTMLLLSGTM